MDEPDSPPNPQARCQTCNDWGVVRLANLPIWDANFGRLIACPTCGEQSPQEALAYRRSASRLSAGEQTRRLDGYWTVSAGRVRAVGAARALLAAGGGWLTLWGGNGTGKSYLMTAIVNEAAEGGQEARYWMLADLLDALRDAYNPAQGEAAYSALLDDLAAVPVLAVDECAAFSPTPWALEKMRQLAERRNRDAERLVTVWACNVDPRGQGGALDFLFSRMTQHTLVELNDGDVRPQLGRDLSERP